MVLGSVCIWRGDLRLHLREAKKVFFTVDAICGDQVTLDQKRIYLALFFSFLSCRKRPGPRKRKRTWPGQRKRGS